jgi:hypothetical protein
MPFNMKTKLAKIWKASKLLVTTTVHERTSQEGQLFKLNCTVGKELRLGSKNALDCKLKPHERYIRTNNNSSETISQYMTTEEPWKCPLDDLIISLNKNNSEA